MIYAKDRLETREGEKREGTGLFEVCCPGHCPLREWQLNLKKMRRTMRDSGRIFHHVLPGFIGLGNIPDTRKEGVKLWGTGADSGGLYSDYSKL